MVDFKKAFNFVNHSILFYKIIKSGLNGCCVKLLQDMYSKLKCKVKVNIFLYKWIKDRSGTNQGGPLSPNMFRFMLADLINYLHLDCGIVLDDEVIAHILWADDLVLMSDTPGGLQRQLDGLFLFCSKYQLIVNELKTKIMIFWKPCSYDFMFNGTRLDIVDKYKYLGTIVNTVQNSRGNVFSKMAEYSVDKANEATFGLYRKCRSLGYLTPQIGTYMFNTYV